VRARIVDASEIPAHVAEKLGLRCAHCGSLSNYGEDLCPNCFKLKRGTDDFDLDEFRGSGKEAASYVHLDKVVIEKEDSVSIYTREKDGKVKVEEK
jgi:hypothetical protein